MADPRPGQRRYPLAPLLEAVDLTQTGFARFHGLAGSSMRVAAERGLTVDAAERWAMRAGLHPMSVWPDYGLAECAAEDCSALFAPVRAGHRFCSDRCRNRVAMRVRYHTDPEARARKIAASARYYDEATDYVRARAQRHHAANRELRLEQMRQRWLRVRPKNEADARNYSTPLSTDIPELSTGISTGLSTGCAQPARGTVTVDDR